MVISRFLSPEEYGTVAMVMVFTGFLAFFNDAGISYVLIREKLDAEQIDFIDNASYLIGLVISLLILVLAYPISVFYEIPELVYPTIVLSVINFLGILAIVPTALVKKNSQFKTLGAIMLISNLFGTFVAISMAYLGFSFWSLILGNLSSTLISAFTFRIHSNLNFINFSLSKAKKGYVLLKDTVSNIAATRFVKYWGNKFDNLIIGKVFSSRDLGIYNRGFQIATLQMNFLSGAMNTIVLPELNRITTRKEQNGYFDFSILFVSLIQAPIIIIILFFPLQLVEFLWGSKWIEVANIIPYFAIFSWKSVV